MSSIARPSASRAVERPLGIRKIYRSVHRVHRRYITHVTLARNILCNCGRLERKTHTNSPLRPMTAGRSCAGTRGTTGGLLLREARRCPGDGVLRDEQPG